MVPPPPLCASAATSHRYILASCGCTVPPAAWCWRLWCCGGVGSCSDWSPAAGDRTSLLWRRSHRWSGRRRWGRARRARAQSRVSGCTGRRPWAWSSPPKWAAPGVCRHAAPWRADPPSERTEATGWCGAQRRRTETSSAGLLGWWWRRRSTAWSRARGRWACTKASPRPGRSSACRQGRSWAGRLSTHTCEIRPAVSLTVPCSWCWER